MNYKLEKFWNSNVQPDFLHLSQMNYKLEKFWNLNPLIFWTSANKSMNYKLEKFWNNLDKIPPSVLQPMNYKLEKFWNTLSALKPLISSNTWTINLKSFEMKIIMKQVKMEKNEL